MLIPSQSNENTIKFALNKYQEFDIVMSPLMGSMSKFMTDNRNNKSIEVSMYNGTYQKTLTLINHLKICDYELADIPRLDSYLKITINATETKARHLDKITYKFNKKRKMIKTEKIAKLNSDVSSEIQNYITAINEVVSKQPSKTVREKYVNDRIDRLFATILADDWMSNTNYHTLDTILREELDKSCLHDAEWLVFKNPFTMQKAKHMRDLMRYY